MRTTRASARSAVLLAGVAALFAAGCALTSKSDPAVPRYFSPERASDLAPSKVSAPASSVELRLGRVGHASHLEERVVYRDSEYELGYYQERHWTESPEQYLKRRLARVLFEDRGLHQVVGGAAATLEMELLAFEEIRSPRRLARVQVLVRLQDQRAVRWEETLTVEEPVAPSAADDAGAMVAALGVALRAVVDRIADRAVRELATLPPPPARAAAE
jgi:cholesterol transport system auxiliary component